jgi:MYXO-CTERM domain-containing protein
MHNAHFRLMTALVGATMCLFAASAYGQTPATTGATGTQTTGAATAPDYNSPATTQTGTSPTTSPNGTIGTTTTGTTTTTDNSVTTPVDNTAPVDSGRRGFNWGLLGLLGLLGLFRGRSTEVRRETYATTTGARAVGTGTAYDDRGNAVPRAASGTSTTGGTGNSGTSGTMGDPGRR